MANQPKKYTKFVATAATATLVASAIVPVASAASFSDVAETNSHAENINALVEAGIIKGFEDGTFKPGQELTRGQVVKMLGKWVEAQGVTAPADFATKARFTDVAVDAKDQELVKYAALVADAKVFNGSNGVLNASGKISRENMALVLDRAYAAINETSLVALAADIEDVKVADLATAKKEAQEAIQALRDLGISGVENFNPKSNVTRGQFASFLNKTINTEVPAVELTVKSAVATSATTLEVVLSDDSKHEVKLPTALEANKETEVAFKINEKEYTAKVTFVVAPLEVTNVVASSENTLTVTGSTLNELNADAISVEGYVVSSVKASENGTSAVVTLVSPLTPSEEVLVKVTDSKSTKEFKVSYAVKLATVELVETTLDDDLANQQLNFKVNGKVVDTDYLALDGYSVKFVAVNKDKNSAVTLFANGSTTSTTGKDIATPFSSNEEFEVEVQLIKDGVAVVADTGVIKVRNLEAQTSGIEEIKFALGATQQYNPDNVTALTGTDFILNSTKVVAGETFYVNQVVTKAHNETVIPAANLISVESSNPAVISYDATAGLLTAEGAGTTKLTVKVGDVTKEVTFTVTNDVRKLTTVKPASKSVTIIKGKATDVKVETLDQYGDPFAVVTGDLTTDATMVTEVLPTVNGTALLTDEELVSDTADSIGKTAFDLEGLVAGSGNVYFKNAEGKVIGSFAVKVTEVNNVASQKLELAKVSSDASYSTDNALEIALGGDDKVRFKLSNFTSEGVTAGAQDLEDYTIEVADATVAVASTTGVTTAAGTITAVANDMFFNIQGLKAGKTDVLLKDANGKVVAKQTVSVTNNPYAVKSVTWNKVSTINYLGKVVALKDVIKLVETENDAIVSAIELNKTTTHKVRLDATTSELYLDVNGNGTNDDNTVLGQFSASVATGATNVSLTDAITGTVATVSGDKGTVIFKFSVDANNDGIYAANEVVASTSVTIDVK